MPTQKPLALLTRLILASTEKKCLDFRPFYRKFNNRNCGKSSNRKFLGIDKEEEFLNISKKRKLEIDNFQIFATYRKKTWWISR